MAGTSGISGLTDRIQWWLVAAAVGLLLTVLVLSHLDESRSLAFAADGVSVVLTFFVSYVVTRHFATYSARANLADLGMATGEQTVLVTDQLRDLASELQEFQTTDDRAELYLSQIASQLARLSSQTELSFKNVQRMAGLQLSIDDLRRGVASTVEPGTIKEVVNCPNCRTPKEVALSTIPGRSRATRCGKCRFGFTVNRLPENKVKLTFEDVVRIDCPNDSCTTSIPVKKRAGDQGVVIRNCFECYARIRFNVDSDEIEHWEIEQPIDVGGDTIREDHVNCPYCSHSVRLLQGRNSRGERLTSCANCTRLIRIVRAAQQADAADRPPAGR
jgi:predicted Zn finger-like uncharacterized protein